MLISDMKWLLAACGCAASILLLTRSPAINHKPFLIATNGLFPGEEPGWGGYSSLSHQWLFFLSYWSVTPAVCPPSSQALKVSPDIQQAGPSGNLAVCPLSPAMKLLLYISQSTFRLALVLCTVTRLSILILPRQFRSSLLSLTQISSKSRPFTELSLESA